MFKELLKNVAELAWLRDISLIFFFLFFVLIVLWVLFLDKKYINRMSNMPLENDNNFENK
jgi:cbb3-type cytochrome oxidase subunit 3